MRLWFLPLGAWMSHINWLHLSDWHHKTPAYDRNVIAGKLIDDIKTRADWDPKLENIDLIAFTGDISFSGETEQFELAHQQLIEPIRNIFGTTVPIYCIPGNHDIQRSAFSNIPAEWAGILAGGTEKNSDVEQLLQDPAKLEILNGPLKNFYRYATKQGCKYDPRKLYFVETIEKGGRKIGIACLNTAWHSARFTIQPAGSTINSMIWDRGLLRLTEAQISDALRQLSDADITIAMMHHPLHWLEETEQAKAEQIVGRHCHIVLHGHEHRPNMSRLSNAFGDTVTIPAGACYNRRIPTDPRYSNATTSVPWISTAMWAPFSTASGRKRTTNGVPTNDFGQRDDPSSSSRRNKHSNNRKPRARRSINFRRIIWHTPTSGQLSDTTS
jgi:UDP-2,3-diacylglucosamine pyrophosphatase LpxH